MKTVIPINFFYNGHLKFSINIDINKVIKIINSYKNKNLYTNLLKTIIFNVTNDDDLDFFNNKKEALNFYLYNVKFCDINSNIKGWSFCAYTVTEDNLAAFLEEKFSKISHLVGKIVRFKYNGGHKGVKIVKVDNANGSYIKGKDLSVETNELESGFRQYSKDKIENFPNEGCIEVLN